MRYMYIDMIYMICKYIYKCITCIHIYICITYVYIYIRITYVYIYIYVSHMYIYILYIYIKYMYIPYIYIPGPSNGTKHRSKGSNDILFQTSSVFLRGPQTRALFFKGYDFSIFPFSIKWIDMNQIVTFPM